MTDKNRKLMGEITFVFNPRKTAEAILYVVEKLGGEVDTYKLFNIMFAADKYRLNEHAHSVTGDLYISDEHGILPLSLNEIIEGKKPKTYLKEMELKRLPFKIAKDKNSLSAKKEPNEFYLAKNDMRSLDKGIEEYGSLSREEVRNKSQKERSWQKTPKGDFIPFELIIENAKSRNYLLENPYGIIV